MLYCSLVYSKIQYGIIVCVRANKTLREHIHVKVNTILRIISSCNIYTPVSHLYRFLTFLKLEDIYALELSKLMHQLHNYKLSDIFCKYFTKINTIHYYKTRMCVLRRIFYLE